MEHAWSHRRDILRVGSSAAGLYVISEFLTTRECDTVMANLNSLAWGPSRVTTDDGDTESAGAVDASVRSCETTPNGVDDGTRTLVLRKLAERGIVRAVYAKASEIEFAANRYSAPGPDTAGGIFALHHDAYPRLTPGQRALSVLVYLTSHSSGGGTEFPQLDHTIPPVAGQAAVWFNSCAKCDGSGEWDHDPSMVHRAIAVAPGGSRKWVINVWVAKSLLDAI